MKVSKHTFSNYDLDATEYSEEEPKILANGALAAKELIDEIDVRGERRWAKELRAQELPEVQRKPNKINSASTPATQNQHREGTTGEQRRCS